MADRVSRRGKRKIVQFRGMFVWIFVFQFVQHLSAHMHLITNGYTDAYQRPTRPIQGYVFL